MRAQRLVDAFMLTAMMAAVLAHLCWCFMPAAGWVPLLTGPVQLDSAMHPGEVSARGSAPVDSARGPSQGSSRGHREIREPSRQKLREILQEADRKDRR